MTKKILFAFIALAAVTAIISIAVALYMQSTTRSWQRQLSSLRDAGEPLSMAEIQLRRPPNPIDRPTIADIVASAADKAKSSSGPISRGVLGMFNGPKINFFSGIPRDAIDKSRKYFTPRRHALEGLDEIHNLKLGRFDIQYVGPAIEMMKQYTETSPPINRLTQLFFLDATLKLIDGDTEASATLIPILFDVVSPLSQEPALMAHIRHMCTAMYAVRILEGVLRVGTLNDETLKKLDHTLIGYLNSHTMKWALWSDRAIYIGVHDQLNQAIGFDYAFFSVTKQDERQLGLDMYGWLIAAGNDPASLIIARNRIQSELSNITDTKMFTTPMLTPLPKSVTLHLCCLAQIQAARIVIAAERFRLANGEFPSTIDQLVPTYLTDIPDDPFDQAKMKITKDDKGLIIYSVGDDGIDHGGQVVPRNGEKRPHDCGFRLLRKSSRGLVVIDSPLGNGQ